MAARTFLTIVLCAATMSGAPTADWSGVAGLPPGTKIEAFPTDRKQTMVKGVVVRTTADALVVSSKSGEVSLTRSEVRIVKAARPGRRSRNGLIGVAVGAAGGYFAGLAICLYCGNEGHSGFGGHGAALGAVLGAIAFLPMPYITIYKAPKK
jgi:hypothetical protein